MTFVSLRLRVPPFFLMPAPLPRPGIKGTIFRLLVATSSTQPHDPEQDIRPKLDTSDDASPHLYRRVPNVSCLPLDARPFASNRPRPGPLREPKAPRLLLRSAHVDHAVSVVSGDDDLARNGVNTRDVRVWTGTGTLQK